METKIDNQPRVRPLLPADFDVWLPLWRGYQEFYKVDLPAETTRTTWNRILDPREPVFGAVALAGGEPVGIVHWILHRSCWMIADTCYLQDLFVAKAKRGHGIGRRLIEHVYEAAREKGCPRVYWLTHETNTDAMVLYDRVAERSGFVQYRKALA